ncbi:hypothetical protein WME75_44670 [Sorangium sp. So ce1014]|uniref:hypothetical protein n=1 Tax=Sorangium sp. So ce1014 TaxID=3133326 RepID=UPI003F63630F
MPFSNLSSPRKVHGLDAEIRGAAFLASPGLVAMVSTDPVRLGVCPIGGAGAKTTNLSLSSAHDVALLSKDVAVVRSDDAVWALLGITHGPKLDQVGRDARHLATRPSGETALALGWDGGATELKLDRTEVNGRTFAVRGSARAFDLTETETHAVMDVAGEGGELRVHPGATPEPGPTLRASLPRAAQNLDRVRGGPKLTAVYKRGAGAVCAIVRSSGKLAAKMLAFGDPVADVAVLESSLFACFADGRVALFDGAAIESAAGAPLAPTASVTLGARGEPAVLVVAGKGSPTLWVGTSAGEIWSLAIVRKQGG